MPHFQLEVVAILKSNKHLDSRERQTLMSVIAEVDNALSAIMVAHRWMLHNTYRLVESLKERPQAIHPRVRKVYIHCPRTNGDVANHLDSFVYNGGKSPPVSAADRVELEQIRTEFAQKMDEFFVQKEERLTYVRDTTDHTRVETVFRKHLADLLMSHRYYEMGQVIQCAREGQLQHIKGIGPEFAGEIADVLSTYIGNKREQATAEN